MRTQLPKLCSQDLLNNLFRHPYTRIQFVRDDLSVTRQTAAAYYINTGDQHNITVPARPVCGGLARMLNVK